MHYGYDARCINLITIRTSTVTPNLQGKTILITGGTNGIGKASALSLAKMGAQVVIVGRNAEKTQATVAELKTQSGNAQIDFLLGDLSLMSEIRRVAEEYKQRYGHLHVLLNNAGGVYAERQETREGLEMTFALNHISYFLLTHLLLDHIRASAPARIINVSSGAHVMGSLDFNDLQNKHNYSLGGFRAYGQSKLMNVLFSYALARRLEGSGVTVNALHPGTVATGFGKNNGGVMGLLTGIIMRFGLSPERGAETSIYLASSAEVEGITGKYFDNRKAVQSSPISYDTAVQEQLWQVSEQITGLQPATV
jgi:NAD(P)-dependent dehydrogenase (short-subunit alcohol dehydrogenase family)